MTDVAAGALSAQLEAHDAAEEVRDIELSMAHDKLQQRLEAKKAASDNSKASKRVSDPSTSAPAAAMEMTAVATYGGAPDAKETDLDDETSVTIGAEEKEAPRSLGAEEKEAPRSLKQAMDAVHHTRTGSTAEMNKDLAGVHDKKVDVKDKDTASDAIRTFTREVRKGGGNPVAAACGIQGFGVLLGALALITVPILLVATLGTKLAAEMGNLNDNSCTATYNSEWAGVAVGDRVGGPGERGRRCGCRLGGAQGCLVWGVCGSAGAVCVNCVCGALFFSNARPPGARFLASKY